MQAVAAYFRRIIDNVTIGRKGVNPSREKKKKKRETTIDSGVDVNGDGESDTAEIESGEEEYPEVFEEEPLVRNNDIDSRQRGDHIKMFRPLDCESSPCWSDDGQGIVIRVPTCRKVCIVSTTPSEGEATLYWSAEARRKQSVMSDSAFADAPSSAGSRKSSLVSIVSDSEMLFEDAVSEHTTTLPLTAAHISDSPEMSSKHVNDASMLGNVECEANISVDQLSNLSNSSEIFKKGNKSDTQTESTLPDLVNGPTLSVTSNLQTDISTNIAQCPCEQISPVVSEASNNTTATFFNVSNPSCLSTCVSNAESRPCGYCSNQREILELTRALPENHTHNSDLKTGNPEVDDTQKITSSIDATHVMSPADTRVDKKEKENYVHGGEQPEKLTNQSRCDDCLGRVETSQTDQNITNKFDQAGECDKTFPIKCCDKSCNTELAVQCPETKSYLENNPGHSNEILKIPLTDLSDSTDNGNKNGTNLNDINLYTNNDTQNNCTVTSLHYIEFQEEEEMLKPTNSNSESVEHFPNTGRKCLKSNTDKFYRNNSASDVKKLTSIKESECWNIEELNRVPTQQDDKTQTSDIKSEAQDIELFDSKVKDSQTGSTICAPDTACFVVDLNDKTPYISEESNKERLESGLTVIKPGSPPLFTDGQSCSNHLSSDSDNIVCHSSNEDKTSPFPLTECSYNPLEPSQGPTDQLPTHSDTTIINSPHDITHVSSPTYFHHITAGTTDREVTSTKQDSTNQIQLPEFPNQKQLPGSPSQKKLPESPSQNQLTESPSQNQLPESPSQKKLPESPSQNQLTESPSQRQLTESPSQNQLTESPSQRQLTESPSQRQLPESPSQRQLPESPSQRQLTESPSQRQLTESPRQKQLPESPSQTQLPKFPSRKQLPDPINQKQLPDPINQKQSSNSLNHEQIPVSINQKKKEDSVLLKDTTSQDSFPHSLHSHKAEVVNSTQQDMPMSSVRTAMKQNEANTYDIHPSIVPSPQSENFIDSSDKRELKNGQTDHIVESSSERLKQKFVPDAKRVVGNVSVIESEITGVTRGTEEFRAPALNVSDSQNKEFTQSSLEQSTKTEQISLTLDHCVRMKEHVYYHENVHFIEGSVQNECSVQNKDGHSSVPVIEGLLMELASSPVTVHNLEYSKSTSSELSRLENPDVKIQLTIEFPLEEGGEVVDRVQTIPISDSLTASNDVTNKQTSGQSTKTQTSETSQFLLDNPAGVQEVLGQNVEMFTRKETSPIDGPYEHYYTLAVPSSVDDDDAIDTDNIYKNDISNNLEECADPTDVSEDTDTDNEDNESDIVFANITATTGEPFEHHCATSPSSEDVTCYFDDQEEEDGDTSSYDGSDDNSDEDSSEEEFVNLMKNSRFKVLPVIYEDDGEHRHIEISEPEEDMEFEDALDFSTTTVTFNSRLFSEYLLNKVNVRECHLVDLTRDSPTKNAVQKQKIGHRNICTITEEMCGANTIVARWGSGVDSTVQQLLYLLSCLGASRDCFKYYKRCSALALKEIVKVKCMHLGLHPGKNLTPEGGRILIRSAVFQAVFVLDQVEGLRCL